MKILTKLKSYLNFPQAWVILTQRGLEKMLTSSIQNFGQTNYEFINNKNSSDLVQKEEREQQPRLDSNNLVNPNIDSLTEESKKVSKESVTESIEKEIDIENKQTNKLEDDYNFDISQKRNKSFSMLGTALDITV